jgi:RNA polymerase sigma-70 factor, ECF subfamily
VKAALHRGRSKLRGMKPQQTRAVLPDDRRRLLEEYISCFNARDWESLQRLIRADARVEIVSGYETVATTYVNRYGTLPWEWRFSVADVAGEVVLVHWRRSGEEWIPSTAVRMWWRDGKVARIRDYVHSEYLFDHSRGEIMELPPVAPAAPIPSPT